MTVHETIHLSKFHRDGFDPNCPVCLKSDGLAGVIKHLTEAEKENRQSGGLQALAVAEEQKRMIGVLQTLKRVRGKTMKLVVTVGRLTGESNLPAEDEEVAGKKEVEAAPELAGAEKIASILETVAERYTWSVDDGRTWFITRDQLVMLAGRVRRGEIK